MKKMELFFIYFLWASFAAASQHDSQPNSEKPKNSSKKVHVVSVTETSTVTDEPIPKVIKTKKVTFKEDDMLTSSAQPTINIAKLVKAFDKVKGFIDNSELDTDQAEMLLKVAKKLKLKLGARRNAEPTKTENNAGALPRKSSLSKSQSKSDMRSSTGNDADAETTTVQSFVTATRPTVVITPQKALDPVTITAGKQQPSTLVDYYTSTVLPQKKKRERSGTVMEDLMALKKVISEYKKETEGQDNKVKEKAKKKQLKKEKKANQGNVEEESHDEPSNEKPKKKAKASAKERKENDENEKNTKKSKNPPKPVPEAEESPKKKRKVADPEKAFQSSASVSAEPQKNLSPKKKEKLREAQKSAKDVLRKLQIEIGREHLRLKKLKAQIRAENNIFTLLEELKKEKKIRGVRRFLFETIARLQPSQRQMEKLADFISMRK